MEVSMKLGQAMYEAQQPKAALPAMPPRISDDNVVDADFEEIRGRRQKKSA